MELTEIERQRRALEENVQKLRQSLKHWQTWEAEYEGLKEELIATGPEELTAEAVAEICKTYGGALVTEKEILEPVFHCGGEAGGVCFCFCDGFGRLWGWHWGG